MKEKQSEPKKQEQSHGIQGDMGLSFPAVEAIHSNTQLPLQRKGASENASRIEKPSLQMKSENKTGLPDNLKTGIEDLSGYSMDNVRVHRNSSKPAQLQAYAYAQGTDIHLGPGQERHLPHEAWHVVQQKQGRVKPTLQMKTGHLVNDNEGLEREADVMGERVTTSYPSSGLLKTAKKNEISSMSQQDTIQRASRGEDVGGYGDPGPFLGIIAEMEDKIVEAIESGAGWEVWLQVELMTAIRKNYSGGAREVRYGDDDKRSVDFVFNPGKITAIELKVESATNAGEFKTQILKDVSKIADFDAQRKWVIAVAYSKKGKEGMIKGAPHMIMFKDKIQVGLWKV